MCHHGVMELEEKAQVAKRLWQHIDNGTTDFADGLLRVPVSVFSDPDLATREVEVFRRRPHVVAHASELANPGDFITTGLLGTPLLVVRQTDGGVKAFSNVCRHRAAKVEFDESGCKRAFACRYHKWSYGRDGSLKSVPYEKHFEGFDKNELGLVEFPTEQRYGLIWVVPTEGETIDIAAEFGDKHDRELLDTGMAESYQYKFQTWRLEMNWKTVFDGVQDVYHTCLLHTTTVCKYLIDNVVLFDKHDKSWRLVVPRKTIGDLRDADADAQTADLMRYVLASYTLYPGTVLVTEPSHVEVWSMTPDPKDSAVCHVTIRFLSLKEPNTERRREVLDTNWEFLVNQALMQEDWFVAKTISDNAPYGGVKEMVYGLNEAPGQHFHKLISADAAAVAEAR